MFDQVAGTGATAMCRRSRRCAASRAGSITVSAGGVTGESGSRADDTRFMSNDGSVITRPQGLGAAAEMRRPAFESWFRWRGTAPVRDRVREREGYWVGAMIVNTTVTFALFDWRSSG